MPGKNGVLSVERWWFRYVQTWLRAQYRRLLLKPPICAHNKHEKRFRHVMRKEWKDVSEAAPCHDKVLHGHPTLAAERRGVHMQLVKILSSRGYIPYDISTSRRTLRAKDRSGEPIPGFHGHFSARDFGFDERNDEIGDKHALLLIDVDYYVEMNVLATHFVPMCLYTFVPGKAVGHTPESSWSTSYDEKGEAVVRYNVDGGNVYKHKMWDYGETDYVAFEVGNLSYVYSIERHRQGDSTHLVVWLQPSVIMLKDTPKYRRVFGDIHVVKRIRAPDYVMQDGDLVTIVDNNLEFQMRAGLYQAIMATVS